MMEYMCKHAMILIANNKHSLFYWLMGLNISTRVNVYLNIGFKFPNIFIIDAKVFGLVHFPKFNQTS